MKVDRKTAWRCVCLWVFGALVASWIDAALARSFSLSPVLGHPLRGRHDPGLLDLVGWALLGFGLPSLSLAARSSIAPLLALAPLPAAIALEELHRREWNPTPFALTSLALLLVAPPLEHERDGRPWGRAWLIAAALALVFVVEEPAHRLARAHYPRAVLWWIGVAACGCALSSVLWRAGAATAAVANAVLWTCALWSLLANARWISKFSVGLLGVVWRSSGWHGYLGESRPVVEVLWSAPAVLALVLGIRGLIGTHDVCGARPPDTRSSGLAGGPGRSGRP